MPDSACNADRRVLLLSADDHVAVALVALEPGDTVAIGDTILKIASRVPMGHKVAVRAIAAGEKVRKYGAPIGLATRAIAVGEHVHTHNLRSDYLPTVALRETPPGWERRP